MFWKNWLVFRRHPVAGAAEILAPPAVMLLLVAVWTGFTPAATSTTEFSSAGMAVSPLTVLATRLAMRGQQLAIVGPASRIRPLQEFLESSYPAFDGGCFDSGSFPALASTKLAPLAGTLTTFESESGLNAYIGASSYGLGGGGGLIWAAIVVNEWPNGAAEGGRSTLPFA